MKKFEVSISIQLKDIDQFMFRITMFLGSHLESDFKKFISLSKLDLVVVVLAKFQPFSAMSGRFQQFPAFSSNFSFRKFSSRI